jgi:hypothetical protein
MSNTTKNKELKIHDMFLSEVEKQENYAGDVFTFGMLEENEKIFKNTDEIHEKLNSSYASKVNEETPSVIELVGSLSKSALGWVQSGFSIPDPETFNARLEICKGCEFWDESGFVNTGRCKKCGCSTQAKLRMSTEKCPIGKW